MKDLSELTDWQMTEFELGRAVAPTCALVRLYEQREATLAEACLDGLRAGADWDYLHRFVDHWNRHHPGDAAAAFTEVTANVVRQHKASGDSKEELLARIRANAESLDIEPDRLAKVLREASSAWEEER